MKRWWSARLCHFVTDCVISSDDNYLYSCSDALKQWDINNGTLVKTFRGNSHSVLFCFVKDPGFIFERNNKEHVCSVELIVVICYSVAYISRT